jgi:hypothetical protein
MEREGKTDDRKYAPYWNSQEKGRHSSHGIGLRITPDGPFDIQKTEGDEADNKCDQCDQERQANSFRYVKPPHQY